MQIDQIGNKRGRETRRGADTGVGTDSTLKGVCGGYFSLSESDPRASSM